MNLPGRQDDTPEPQRQPTQDPTPSASTIFDSDHSSEDDSDQDEHDLTQSSTTMSSFSAREAVDLYDKLPPELLEHILTLLPHPTLFCCTTLSKRWARIVIPHLWNTPWMMYYVSWMKLLQTISSTSLSTSTSSSSSGSLTEGLKDPAHKQNRPAYSRALANGSSNDNMDDTTKDPALAWDNFSDHEDEDPSGLLRLAENQRRENLTVAGWEIPDRTLTLRTPSTSSGGYRCGNGTRGNNNNNNNTCLHESEPNSVASDDTKPSFAVSSRPFNVQGKSRLCPYVDMPSSSSLTLSLSAATDSIGMPTATSHKHASSKRQKKNTAHSTPPSPGLVPSPPSKPFLRPNYGPLIRTLDFSELYYILSDKFLTHLFPHTPQLTTLIVNSPKQFTDESLYVLASCCRALQRCELLGCDQISDSGVHFLLDQQHQHHYQGSKNPTEGGSRGQGGSTLRALSLANRVPVTDGVLQHLAYVSFASKLEQLNLANAVFVTGQDPGLRTVFRCCTGLKALNVSHCQGVTDELLGMLGCADKLQRLSVAHCYEVTDQGICAVAMVCGQLEELDVSACGAVSDTSLYALGRGCRGFRRLVVDEQYGGRMTEQGLRMFPWEVEVLQGWRRYSQRSGRSSRRIF
ncbi:hypothetical protein BGZ74_008449 [Mortierella antarctica]|nr:hypothetical protein BGZ74_008449 [Mortierella antarctica]